jgi:hypothetical protein
MDANFNLLGSQMTLFHLLRSLISDSTSRHYDLSLQWVLTPLCPVSGRSLDVFCLPKAGSWLTVWLFVSDFS